MLLTNIMISCLPPFICPAFLNFEERRGRIELTSGRIQRIDGFPAGGEMLPVDSLMLPEVEEKSGIREQVVKQLRSCLLIICPVIKQENECCFSSMHSHFVVSRRWGFRFVSEFI